MNPSTSILTRRDAFRLTLATAGMLGAQTIGQRTDPITVQCAGLEFLFDPKLGFVRHLKWNGIEVLNGIYVAVRDEVWGTVAPQVSNVIVETEVDAFKIVFEVICKQGAIEFLWNGSIVGSPRALTFQMDGEAKSTFRKNRIGFAVLHPLNECAGKPCKIDKEGNVTQEGTFPDAISPHQPFKDMTGIRHEVYPGLMAEVRFTGDTFELEDHRNWTDGNYKTYCTPLAKPFPVEVKQGAKIVQSVSVRLAGTPKPPPPAYRRPVEVLVEAAAGPAGRKMPAIGFGIAMENPALTAAQAGRLRLLAPSHLRLDLFPGKIDAALDRAAADLKLLPGVGLEAAVFVSAAAEQELAAVAKAVASRNLKVGRWMVFHVDEATTDRKWLDIARKHLRGSAIGGGTNQYFTELNRGRPDMSAMDFAAYSLNPQVHAFDDMSIFENLSPQADTVRTGRTFIGANKGLIVSPVTLKPRFNPMAKVQDPATRVDARQGALLGAAWTAASLSYLTGADSVTYYETHGSCGLMDAAAVFPMFHAFAALSGYRESIPMIVSDSACISVLGLRAAGATGLQRLVLANLTDAVQRVKVPGAGGGPASGWKARILDAETFGEATKQPERFLASHDWEIRGRRRELSLLPYATVVLTAIA